MSMLRRCPVPSLPPQQSRRPAIRGLALLIAPLAAVLLSPPFAALVAKPGQAGAAQRLRFSQSSRAPLLRSHLQLLIRPSDRSGPVAALLLEWPARFDGRLLLDSLRLCRMAIPPQVTLSRCVEELPARVEQLGPGSLRVVPERPLAGESVDGVSLLLFNPSRAGLYPVRLRVSQAADPAAESVPLGSWWIPIDSNGD
jgi:hypothetical protein